MFLNVTNHPSEKWDEAQREEALRLSTNMDGEPRIEDWPFPNVPPDADEAEVARIADDLAGRIADTRAVVVLIQGEMTLTFRVVNTLKALGFKVVAATSKREVVETPQPDGSVKKITTFRFVRFREY